MSRSPALVPAFLFMAGVVLLLGATAPAPATTLAPWTLSDFVANMNAAVVGTVTAVDVRWNEEHTQIHSYVTIDVDQVVAGEALSTPLVLDELGGRVGRTISTLEGAPVYRTGEQVFVFVEKVDDSYRTLGFFQGKYTLEVDPVTGREMFVQRVPAGDVVVAGPEGMLEPETVAYSRNELIARVRELAGVK